MSRVRGITLVLGLIVSCAFLGGMAARSARQGSVESEPAIRAARENAGGRWQIHQANRSYTDGRELDFDEQLPILLDSETGNAYVLYPMSDSKREENENDPGYSWVEIPRHSMQETSGKLFRKRAEEQTVHTASF